MRRGELYYIEIPTAVGSEMRKNRPGVIVSCEELIATSPTVQVVFCSASPKRQMPEHVEISELYRPSTVMCEQIYTVDRSRLGTFLGAVSEDELKKIDAGIVACLGLREPVQKSPAPIPDVSGALGAIRKICADLIRALKEK